MLKYVLDKYLHSSKIPIRRISLFIVWKDFNEMFTTRNFELANICQVHRYNACNSYSVRIVCLAEASVSKAHPGCQRRSRWRGFHETSQAGVKLLIRKRSLVQHSRAQTSVAGVIVVMRPPPYGRHNLAQYRTSDPIKAYEPYTIMAIINLAI